MLHVIIPTYTGLMCSLGEASPTSVSNCVPAMQNVHRLTGLIMVQLVAAKASV